MFLKELNLFQRKLKVKMELQPQREVWKFMLAESVMMLRRMISNSILKIVERLLMSKFLDLMIRENQKEWLSSNSKTKNQ